MGQVYLKTILKMNEKSKSKIGPPGVTIRGQIIPQPKSPRWLKKRVSRTSSNGPPRNYRGVLKVNLKTCANGTKLRDYTYRIWLEMLAKALNMLIRLKGNNYYSKVFKRVNYKLSNSTFWVVIDYYQKVLFCRPNYNGFKHLWVVIIFI